MMLDFFTYELPKYFLIVFNMSLTAAYVALIVIITRFFLKKVPKIFSYSLWSVVLFRLCLPFSFESMFSLIFVKSAPISQEIITNASSHQIPLDITNPLVNQPVTGNLPIIAEKAALSFKELAFMVIGIIWLLGIAAILCYSIVSYFRLVKSLKTAIHIRDNIYQSDLVKTPFVIGIFKPKIYLSCDISDAELPYILLHEQTHIKRFDYLIKPIAFLLCTVHWFNPFIWISYFLMSKDMEASCDESVMKHTAEDIRGSYSTSLLSLSAKQSGFPSPLAFGESNIKFRIKNILQYKKPAFWVIITAVIAVTAIGIGLISNPKLDKKSEKANDLAGQFLKYKTEFVGDNSKVSGIVNLFEFIKDVDYDHLSLQTENEPYGITIHLKTKLDRNNNEENDFLKLLSYDYERNALIAFSLIGNCDYVTYSLAANKIGTESELTYTREWADTVVGTDIRTLSENEEDFGLLVYAHIEEMPAAEDLKAIAKTDYNKIEIYTSDASSYDANGNQTPFTTFDMNNFQKYALNQKLKISEFVKADENTKYDIAFDIKLLDSNKNALCLFRNVGGKTYIVHSDASGKENNSYFADAKIYENVMTFLLKNFKYIGGGSLGETLESKFINELLDSNLFEHGELSFTIPKEIPKGNKLFIQVSGRIPMGEDFMSYHGFEKESADSSFEAGKTYREKDIPQNSEIYLNVELVKDYDNSISESGSRKFTPLFYADTQSLQNDAIPKECKHEKWEHLFNRAMVQQIDEEKFNEWVVMPENGYCGSTIYDFMTEFKLDLDKFYAVTNNDPTYKDIEKYWQDGLTDYVVAQTKGNIKPAIALVMTEGKYRNQRALDYGGGIYENNYTGSYELQSRNGEQILSRFPIAENNFDKFEIFTDDYNYDNNIDFTIGSWGSSSGKIYNLYTVDKKGKITKLNEQELFVASHDFSINFQKLPSSEFTYQWYNNNIGEKVTEVYGWQDGNFVRITDAYHESIAESIATTTPTTYTIKGVQEKYPVGTAKIEAITKNTGNGSLDVSPAYDIEEFVDDNWVKVNVMFPTPPSISSVYPPKLTAKQIYDISPLTQSGKYRIRQDFHSALEKLTGYVEFELEDTAQSVLPTSYTFTCEQVSYPIGTYTIITTITNTGEGLLQVSRYDEFEFFDGVSWVLIPKYQQRNDTIPLELGRFQMPNEAQQDKVHTTYLKVAGKYRVKKTFNHAGAAEFGYAEFTLE